MFISAYLTEFISFAPQPYQSSLYDIRFVVDWVYFNVIEVAFTRFAICEQVHIALV